MIRSRAAILGALALAAPLAGCNDPNKSIGAGVSSVTTSTIDFVCLSRKDTPGTIAQVARNNTALDALGKQKPDCKVVRASAPTS